MRGIGGVGEQVARLLPGGVFVERHHNDLLTGFEDDNRWFGIVNHLR